MFCENCGLQFLPKQSVCDRCRVPPTRHWLQLMGLSTLLVVVVCNSLVGLFLLPRLGVVHHGQFLFRAWLWLDVKTSMYGWLAFSLGLLTWDYFFWTGSRPRVKGWITRKVLAFLLAAGIAPVIPTWLPAGQPPASFVATFGKHPDLSTLSAWGVVILVLALLCSNAETRDSLLGHGRVLHLVSLAALLLILSMTLVGWSLTFH